MLTIRPRFYVVPTLVFLGAGFALANGLGYGAGNLRQYLLHGLHAIDADFLSSDWFTSQTRPHHLAFNWLIGIFAKISALDLAFASANAVFALVFVCCIFFLAARHYRTPLVVTAITVLIVLFVPRPYLGLTTIINMYFQPSTVGAVGLLLGLVCLCYERYKTAGVVLLVAGVFHINYMVWSIAVVGLVVAANLNRIGVRRALYVLAPIAISVLYHLPFIAVSRAPEQLASGPIAARILHDIYMPYHSRPLTWGTERFIQFGLLMSAAAVAWWFVRPEWRPNRITKTVLLALGLALGVGTLLTTVVQIDVVALIFPFRLAPFLILAAQIVVAGAISTSAQFEKLSIPKTLVLWALLGALYYWAGVSPYELAGIGAIATALLAGRLYRERRRSSLTATLVLAGLTGLLYLGGAGRTGVAFVAAFAAAGIAWRWTQRSRWKDGRWPSPLVIARVLVPMCIAAFVMRMGASRKDLAGPPPSPEEQVLYAWCQARTDRNAIFIIPPGLAGFRLGAERAVVADWKCMPILAHDTVEWYRRLATICGGDFGSLAEATTNFERIGVGQARQVAREFGARYLVARLRDHKGDLRTLRPAYVDDTFAVLDLREE
ncbi:MAG: hypothetical protein O7D94_08745 [Planctomycetota bacterium]|nr:hypothetical protein [Planctomycetota bacterium]